MFNFFSIFLASYGVYVEHPSTLLPQKKKKFAYFIGKGNNKNLIISIFKKRWWWTETDTISSADFVWTQLKVHSVLEKQQSLSN